MNVINVLIYSKNPGVRILRHILFWTTDIASYIGVVSVTREITPIEIFGVLLKIIPVILTTYFVLYYLIPNYSTLNDGALLLWILGLFIFMGMGTRVHNYYVNSILAIPQTTPFVIFDFRLIINQVFSHMAVVCMAITIKLMKKRNELAQHNEALQMEKKNAELNFLKSQMHPHFLFNTLNTLYSETMQDSGKGELVVLHLSSLLRFILDECNKPLIPIRNEIRVILDFVALEILRHGDRLNVRTDIQVSDDSALISPLVFLPFVENSFKHTLDKQRGRIEIDIRIHMIDNEFHLAVENDRISHNGKINGHRVGKGIANVTRQLELVYGKEYALHINGSAQKYHVSLKVPAKSRRDV